MPTGFATFTVFYDGNCPLCMTEMKHLMKRNTQQKLIFVDINHPQFSTDHPGLSQRDLQAKIHGRWSHGEMLTGLDVTYTAWRLVGKGWLYAPLRWPVIRWFADWAYTVFARHRQRISTLLMGKSQCENGHCNPTRGDSHERK
ncbi:thiol-disulfide oxidoreductase DCC family protein [Alteromonas oceanisediminis]|uniref:thiol-disulfide oxidoreductase DCC family protein n=1 Tax=Alteromonas oceanisediminis TaxID=2836180 RepID=UPI001BDA7AA5|nr:DUF393 domain-containing protein [Alteromonas oceanisediminis]MBT0585878.1 DUF393 domain-containing protein [Alteromonas oceanisediminis]